MYYNKCCENCENWNRQNKYEGICREYEANTGSNCTCGWFVKKSREYLEEQNENR